MATQLNQIVAIEKGVKAETDRTLTDAYHTIQSTPRLTGIARVYSPRDDDGEQLPQESQIVQVSVETVIQRVTTSLARMYDVTFTKDATNMLAKADVVVDGVTLVEGAPVPYLLWLEKQLIHLHTFVSELPTLDPAKEWMEDGDTGIWKTPPTETTRTKKIPRNHELAPATQHHPAQVQVYNEDVVVGIWSTINFSGALRTSDAVQMKARVNTLIEAVKMAREKANTQAVEDRYCGDAVMEYVFGGHN